MTNITGAPPTKRFLALHTLLFVLLASIAAVAQLPTGTILGAVNDATGAVVHGVTITIRNADTSVSRTITAASDGSYRLPALPVGNYEIQVQKDGFKKASRKGLS